VSARILFVGFGRRGHEWLAAVRSRHDSVPVAAVDPDGAAREAAERLGLAAFPELHQALAATDATAAIVCTPPADHVAGALACLRAGVGVLVEKPLALSLADARAVADAGESAALPALVAHNFRHRPLERTIRKALGADAIGAVRTIKVASARPAVTPIGEHTPLWDLSVHHLDLLRLRLGAVPDVVEARCSETGGGVTYALRLDWEGRAAADYWLHEGASVYHHAEWLEGSGGALRVVDGRASLVTPGRRVRRLRAPRGPQPERVLLDALLGGKPSTADARESLGTIAMVEAAVRSIDVAGPVSPASHADATA
jgi:predicted dehydrogenase